MGGHRILAAFVVGVWSFAARAATMEITFDGTVKEVSGGVMGGSLQVGAPVHGVLQVRNDGLVDRSPSPGQGTFGGVLAPGDLPVISFSLSIGSYLASSGPLTPDTNNVVIVYDGQFVPPIDEFMARSPVVGPSVNGFAPSFAQFALSAFEDRLSSDAIPSAAVLQAFGISPSVQGFDVNFLFFVSTDFQRVDWRLESYSVVPEAGTWVAVVGLGLLLLTRAPTQS